MEANEDGPYACVCVESDSSDDDGKLSPLPAMLDTNHKRLFRNCPIISEDV